MKKEGSHANLDAAHDALPAPLSFRPRHVLRGRCETTRGQAFVPALPATCPVFGRGPGRTYRLRGLGRHDPTRTSIPAPPPPRGDQLGAATGTGRTRPPAIPPFRSTPTCVGLGPDAGRLYTMTTVHPHVRGAWSHRVANSPHCCGPSPRAWGLAAAAFDPPGDGRSIPTCVGLGPTGPSGRPGGTVHPHVRGAWLCEMSLQSQCDGPSPRAWGLAGDAQVLGCRPRSIPTCVGLGGPCRRRRRTKPVHPHVRGAWRTCDSNTTTSPGPSPRAWGLVLHVLLEEAAQRSIPTCVGLGPAYPVPHGPQEVHPHVRGAWRSDARVGAGLEGPSPRAWGLVGQRDHRQRSKRSIPTCVGLGAPNPP